nr:MAG TPA: hypothetical protein [Caudoviricetes sp.]
MYSTKISIFAVLQNIIYYAQGIFLCLKRIYIKNI